jgi:hypothetical protein
MTWFWIVGIIVNVGLAGLAIWWVLKQMKRPPEAPDGEDDGQSGVR